MERVATSIWGRFLITPEWKCTLRGRWLSVWLFNLCNLLLEVKWERSIWFSLSFQWGKEIHCKLLNQTQVCNERPFVTDMNPAVHCDLRRLPHPGLGHQAAGVSKFHYLKMTEGDRKGELGTAQEEAAENTGKAPCSRVPPLPSFPLFTSLLSPSPPPFLSPWRVKLKEERKRKGWWKGESLGEICCPKT